MSVHRDLPEGEMHFLQQWSVADNTARDALSVAADDVGKVCEVGGAGAEKTFYILADDSPMTWTEIGGGGGAGTVTEVTSANADATVATTTTTPVITIVQAPALRSATTTVDVASATAPTSGQVLTATSGTAATWQTPSAGGSTIPAINGFRLTLTTAVPVTTSDVTTATTIYCTPYKGNQISLYDGASAWTTVSSAEFSLAVGTLTSGLNYDVFCYNNGGTATLEFAAWTNDTTRATALVFQDGVLVKTGATTRRYMGTFRTISTTETCDTERQRFLFNFTNQVYRKLKVVDTTDSWAYSTASFRQANNSATNQVEIVNGYSGTLVNTSVYARALSSGATARNVASGIGVNSTTVNSADVFVSDTCTSASANVGTPNAHLYHTPAEGYTYYAWLEYGGGADTQTWSGDSGVTFLQTGMVGGITN